MPDTDLFSTPTSVVSTLAFSPHLPTALCIPSYEDCLCYQTVDCKRAETLLFFPTGHFYLQEINTVSVSE